jgi:hypothetical protein
MVQILPGSSVRVYQVSDRKATAQPTLMAVALSGARLRTIGKPASAVPACRFFSTSSRRGCGTRIAAML